MVWRCFDYAAWVSFGWVLVCECLVYRYMGLYVVILVTALRFSVCVILLVGLRV